MGLGLGLGLDLGSGLGLGLGLGLSVSMRASEPARSHSLSEPSAAPSAAPALRRCSVYMAWLREEASCTPVAAVARTPAVYSSSASRPAAETTGTSADGTTWLG